MPCAPPELLPVVGGDRIHKHNGVTFGDTITIERKIPKGYPTSDAVSCVGLMPCMLCGGWLQECHIINSLVFKWQGGITQDG